MQLLIPHTQRINSPKPRFGSEAQFFDRTYPHFGVLAVRSFPGEESRATYISGIVRLLYLESGGSMDSR